MESRWFILSGKRIDVYFFDTTVRIEHRRQVLHEWDFHLEQKSLAERWYGYVCTLLIQHLCVPTFFCEIMWPNHVEKIEQILEEAHREQTEQSLHSAISTLQKRRVPGEQIALFLGLSEAGYRKICESLQVNAEVS